MAVVPEFQPVISYLDHLQVNNDIIRARLAATEWPAFLVDNGSRLTVTYEFEFGLGRLDSCAMFEIGWALGGDITSNCDEVLLRRLVDLSPKWRLYNLYDLVKRVWLLKHSQTVEAVTDREQPEKLAFPGRSLPYSMSQVLPDKPYTAHDPDQDAKALLDLVE
ncbi:hypothetical protein BDZ88DRAFT_451163 [Geranomyces variabilis]|nr:hypothetical protein BDZ88DRAFT_451163 [Geranomyces variabilis]KAJ3141098.1 hypothetical protein HDU90_007122 [Geranomyces variabilis]